MNPLRTAVASLAAYILLLWRWTCRFKVINDPRPGLRAQKAPYVYALLHAHQLNAILVNDEQLMAAMVSRSHDGDLLVPLLRLRRVAAVRGSTRKNGQDKGGRDALTELTHMVGRGIPALIAVDGPRGPRGFVHPGVAHLAMATHAVILPVIVIANRTWRLRKTWDQFEIPKPFSTIALVFGPMISPAAAIETTRTAVTTALASLEITANAMMATIE